MKARPNNDTIIASLLGNSTITENVVYKGRILKEVLIKVLEESDEDAIYLQALINEGSLEITIDEFEFSHFM